LREPDQSATLLHLLSFLLKYNTQLVPQSHERAPIPTFGSVSCIESKLSKVTNLMRCIWEHMFVQVHWNGG